MLSLARSLLAVCGLAMSIIGLTTVTSPLLDPAADARSSPTVVISRPAISSLPMTQVGDQPVSSVGAPKPNREGNVLLLRYARSYLLDAAAAARRHPGAGPGSGEARPNAWFFTAQDSVHSTPPPGPSDSEHPGADGGDPWPRGRGYPRSLEPFFNTLRRYRHPFHTSSAAHIGLRSRSLAQQSPQLLHVAHRRRADEPLVFLVRAWRRCTQRDSRRMRRRK